MRRINRPTGQARLEPVVLHLDALFRTQLLFQTIQLLEAANGASLVLAHPPAQAFILFRVRFAIGKQKLKRDGRFGIVITYFELTPRLHPVGVSSPEGKAPSQFVRSRFMATPIRLDRPFSVSRQ